MRFVAFFKLLNAERIRKGRVTQITETRDNEVITIKIEGKVDTNTNLQLQDAILKSFQKVNQVVLDFEVCDYVSTAGLRVLLIGQETARSKKGTMKLVHVPAFLMKTFEITGFVKMLTIE